MITKYLTSLTATFNPLSPAPAHRIPRLLLSFIPPTARTTGGVTVKTNILSSSTSSSTTPSTTSQQQQPSSLTLSFRDGRELKFVEITKVPAAKVKRSKGTKKEGGIETEKAVVVPEGVFDLGKLGIRDVVEEVDRHSRVLRRKEELGE